MTKSLSSQETRKTRRWAEFHSNQAAINAKRIRSRATDRICGDLPATRSPPTTVGTSKLRAGTTQLVGAREGSSEIQTRLRGLSVSQACLELQSDRATSLEVFSRAQIELIWFYEAQKYKHGTSHNNTR